MSVEVMAEIYAGLAEALAFPVPGWLSIAGSGWHLYRPVLKLASWDKNPLWQEAFLKIAEVPRVGIEIRQLEYREIFLPYGDPPIRLYECQHVDGRFPGPVTFTVKNIYQQAGLVVDGAEMPDHASVELAFLAYLCKQEALGGTDSDDWRAARRLFIQNHAGKWLPQVGRVLLRSDPPAWAALGQVLVASMDVFRKNSKSIKTSDIFPNIAEPTQCNLCGFCVQVCPDHALQMHEDETTTELWLQPEKCVGCSKCEQVCEPGALTVNNSVQAVSPVLLRCSKRSTCPRCGTPTVSQAELEAVSARLGEHPAWLDTCLRCR
jgi:Fe-S-cluster-containing hydrogenase component 2